METSQVAAASVTPPSIGAPWPGIDGVYAGISKGEEGQPDAHLVLLNAKPEADLSWSQAVKWAEGLGDGARLPTRFESALLYAHLRDQFDINRWHWTGTQYSSYDAWGQYFDGGYQGYDLKKAEARARAVRRLILQSFNPSEQPAALIDSSQVLADILTEIKGARADVQAIFLADVGAA